METSIVVIGFPAVLPSVNWRALTGGGREGGKGKAVIEEKEG